MQVVGLCLGALTTFLDQKSIIILRYMTPHDVNHSCIVRANALHYPWEEVDVVHEPGHVTRYVLWNGEDGQLTGIIKDITQREVVVRTVTDKDVIDLGLLAIRTKWGLKKRSNSVIDQHNPPS